MFNNSFYNYIRAGMRFRRVAYLSGALLFLLIVATFCPIYLVPEVTEAATKDANPATLTYNATSSTASVSLNVTDLAGNFATSGSNEKASFSLSTNNATGYTLNLKTGDSTTSLSDGTNTIASITNTNGITADNFSNNTWGLLPSKYNGTTNTTNYYPASSAGFKIDETSTANTTANTYTVGLGLKANYSVAAGTYTTANTNNGNTGASLVLEYVANAVTYSINYYTNTTDTVTGMPSINPQTGAVAQGTTSTSVNLASAPSRTGYTFIGWCKGANASTSNITVKTDGTPDVCSTTTYTAGQSFGIDATKSPDTYYLFAMWQRISFTITRQYKLQDTAGNYPSTYTADTNATVLYGDSYTYTIAATTSHQAASTTITNVTSAQTISLDVPRVHVTCNTQFRYEDQDGGFGSYTSDTATWAYYGGSCSYSKSEQYYRGSTSAANDTTATASASNVTSTTTLSVTLYRNVYNLTVTAGTNTSGPTGGGNKRWGQSVTVGVTKASNTTCITYATPTWTATAGTAPSAGASSSYNMPKSDAQVSASSTATNVKQNITLTRTGGAASITIGSTTYTGGSTTLECGTYNISGSYDRYYEFSSWAGANGVAVTSASSASTTMTVSGAGTLTLSGSEIKTYMQDLSLSDCQSVASSGNFKVYDRRDESDYTVRFINGYCWMTQNLRILGTVSATDSNFTGASFNVSQYSLDKNDSTYTTYCNNDNGYNYACFKNTGSSVYGVWYNYYSATVGTISGASNYTVPTNDICPSGWHLPTGPSTISNRDFSKLVGNTSSEQQSTSGLSAFGAVAGGNFSYGIRQNSGWGWWWSANAYVDSNRYSLGYNSGTGLFDGAYGVNMLRTAGNYIRCVKTS